MTAKSKIFIIALFGLVLAGGIALVGGKFLSFSGNIPLEFQNGLGYVSWSENGYMEPASDESLEALAETGANYVSILVTWYQTTAWSNDIHRFGTTPSDESIIHAIRKVHGLGMKVMLKPHLDILDKSEGTWRGDIGGLKEEDWNDWFRQYEEFIMRYIDIANKEKVEMFCIGTELSTTVTTKGYLWRELIKRVRSKYRGLLTYASHWDNYMDVRFWDLLDYVGINPYFPLTDKVNPSYEELKEGWAKWAEEMETFQKEVNKPIIFPEIGCNSCDGAAIRPWEHTPIGDLNLELQKNYYKVIIDIFYEKDWFYGQYWWYWGTNKNMGGPYNRGFTPQNKPAQELIKERYSVPVQRKSSFMKE